MKKKGFLIILITFLLFLLGLSSYFLLRYKQSIQVERGRLFSEEIAPQIERLDLKIDEKTVLGCIVNKEEQTSKCLHRLSNTFEDIPLLSYYKKTEDIPEGFVLLSISKEKLEQYDPNTEEIYIKWIDYINENEDEFFFKDVDEKRHILLDSYFSWKITEMKKMNTSTQVEDIKKVLLGLENEEYVTLTPIKDVYREEVCNIEDIDCSILTKYYEIPYPLIEAFKDLDYESIDIFSKEDLSKLYMLSFALQAMGDKTNVNYEMREDLYRNFENTISTQYSLNREEIYFISDYLPQDLIEFREDLYKSWSTNIEKRADYITLIDIYCRDSGCLKNKLNLLYDYYEN